MTFVCETEEMNKLRLRIGELVRKLNGIRVRSYELKPTAVAYLGNERKIELLEMRIMLLTYHYHNH
tara:strand:- start:276 stop:473 length:198 start_codon:yes stop_codon:yes gene_type:complete